MTPQRARYIIENRLLGGSLKYSFVGRHGARDESLVFEDGMTELEVRFVLSVWDEMDGNTSFMDALVLIAKGELPRLRA